MSRNFLVILIVAIVLAVGLGYYFGYEHGWEKAVTNVSDASVPNETESEEVDFEASFVIFTDGILRSFANPMYHYLYEEVYIGENPYSVIVKNKTVTWDDFFQTLPLSLTNDCLVTGDGDHLCNSSKKQLKFYLNGELKPDLLDMEIQPNDLAVIIYGVGTEAQVRELLHRAEELQSVKP